MKKGTTLNVLEKIDITMERIKELQPMINNWEDSEGNSVWDTECSTNPSAPFCLLFND